MYSTVKRYVSQEVYKLEIQSNSDDIDGSKKTQRTSRQCDDSSSDDGEDPDLSGYAPTGTGFHQKPKTFLSGSLNSVSVSRDD